MSHKKPVDPAIPPYGRFYRDPHTTRQRDRWLAILEVLDKHTIRNQKDFRRHLNRLGHGIAHSLLQRDLDALHVIKVDGVYMQSSPDGNVELHALLRQRLIVVCEKIIAVPPNLVVLKVNTGAASWIAAVINELNEPEILSVMWQDDSVWLATTPGSAQDVAKEYIGRWRATDEQLVRPPTTPSVRRPV